MLSQMHLEGIIATDLDALPGHLYGRARVHPLKHGDDRPLCHAREHVHLPGGR